VSKTFEKDYCAWHAANNLNYTVCDSRFVSVFVICDGEPKRLKRALWHHTKCL